MNRPLAGLASLSCLLIPLPASLADDRTSAAGDPIVLTFKGQIDGSEEIKITPAGATWRHLYWEMPPAPVSLNGVEWDPSARKTLPNEGRTRFLPRAVDFESARLKKVEGRDTVALERNKDSLVIHICDSPFEPAPYEFQVTFRPRKAGAEKDRPRARPKRTKLRVVAEIDGSDELRIDSRGAHWTHTHWEWPARVFLNNVEWDPEESPDLKNEGRTRFLAGPVDFSTAKMTRSAGRDLVVMEHTDGGLLIHFADSPPSGSTYDLTITFGD